MICSELASLVAALFARDGSDLEWVEAGGGPHADTGSAPSGPPGAYRLASRRSTRPAGPVPRYAGSPSGADRNPETGSVGSTVARRRVRAAPTVRERAGGDR